MKGGVFPVGISEAQARELMDAEPSMSGRDLARDVTPARASHSLRSTWAPPAAGGRAGAGPNLDD